MKNSTIAWFFAAAFLATSILFCCLYLSERHSLQKARAALTASEMSEAKLRDNLQATVTQSDRQTAQAAVQNRVGAISGIYYCDTAYGGPNKMDLRSDATAVLFVDTSSGEVPSSKTRWVLAGDGTVTIGTSMKFRIEQDDLIDSRGNRWLHIR